MKVLYLCVIIIITSYYAMSSDPYGLAQDKSKRPPEQQETGPITPQKELWMICTQTETQEIDTLLEQNQQMLFEADSDGNTIMHIAAQNISQSNSFATNVQKQRFLFRQLLEKFPKVTSYSVLRQRNKGGDTPLHILTSGAYTCDETISLCLQYDPSCARVKNSSGKFPDECVSSTQAKLFNIRCAITDPE